MKSTPPVQALNTNWIPMFDIALKRTLSKSLNLDVLFMKTKESEYDPGISTTQQNVSNYLGSERSIILW